MRLAFTSGVSSHGCRFICPVRRAARGEFLTQLVSSPHPTHTPTPGKGPMSSHVPSSCQAQQSFPCAQRTPCNSSCRRRQGQGWAQAQGARLQRQSQTWLQKIVLAPAKLAFLPALNVLPLIVLLFVCIMVAINKAKERSSYRLEVEITLEVFYQNSA